MKNWKKIMAGLCAAAMVYAVGEKGLSDSGAAVQKQVL